MAFKNIADVSFSARVRPDKIFCPPPGIDGGQPGRTGEVRFNGEVLTRFPILTLEPGDEIEMRMPGGAGFGPVGDRQSTQVLEDLRLGYITRFGAEHDYGVRMESVNNDDPSFDGNLD
jgi:N-methylhydantoinase B